MIQLKEIAKTGYRRVLVWRARPSLQALAAVDDDVSRLLADALKEAFTGQLTPEEARWVRQIETLRHRLAATQDSIEIVDYGAGSPDEPRSASQMEAGRIQHTTVSEITQSSKGTASGRMLLKLIRKFQPATCVELGTAVGISAAYQAAALSLNGTGTLLTLEGAPSLAQLSRENLHGLGLANVEVVSGRFQDTLAGVLDRHQPVGFAFIDGHHDGQAMLAYFEQMVPYLAERAVLVFDDILYYATMRAAWETLAADPRVPIAIDLARMGICILDPRLHSKATYTIPMI